MRQRQADDDIFRVHSRYLGPPGFTLPFSIPYRAILPAGAAGLAALVLLSPLGIGLWRFVLAIGIAVATGALADKFSGGDRPVTALPGILARETGAPRPSAATPADTVIRPGAVPVIAARANRNDQGD